MKNIFFVLMVMISFAACKSSGDKTNYDQMATDLCTCMRPLADMNEKIKVLIKEGKTDEVAALFADVERIASEGEVCAKSLEEKYGLVEGESEEKATAALKKNCPDIAQMLEQSEAAGQ